MERSLIVIKGEWAQNGGVLVGFDLQLNRQEEVIMAELHTSDQGSQNMIEVLGPGWRPQ